MDIVALQGKHAELLSKAEAIGKSVAAGATMTEDQSAEVTKLLDDADGINKEIEGARAADALQARLGEAVKTQAASQPRRSQPSADPLQGVTAGKGCFEDDPKKGYKSKNDFLIDVMRATDNGRASEMGDQLIYLKATVGSDEHSGASDPFGGFLVPVGFMQEELRVDPEMDPMGALVRQIPMATRIVEIPARTDKNHTTTVSGGLSVSRRDETGSIASARQEREQVRLEAFSLFGLTFATEELLNDSPISLFALINDGFRDEFQAKIIDERINGTGVGEFMGVLNSDAKIEVAKEVGQAADTIKGQNIVKMRARCWGYTKAIWIANHDTLPQLTQTHLPGTNSDSQLWQNSLLPDVPDMLFGRPIVFSEYVNTIGDVGDIILCNWTQYLQGTLQPLQSAESVHVRFLNHERAFKIWERNAGGLWWRSALTPKKSSDTLSPIITLAERA